jgi:hypothetical protein
MVEMKFNTFEASNQPLLILALFLLLIAWNEQTLNEVQIFTNQVNFFIKQLLLSRYIFNNKILFWD